MEDFKKKNGMDANDKEIVFSKSVKAGKRIYYLDVKKNRKDELFLAITESKKVVSGEGDTTQINFEKHKIFLYKEDFEKFVGGLLETIAFINENQKEPMGLGYFERGNRSDISEIALAEDMKAEVMNGEIKIDIDFE
ncbi:DUF3276 family protein [Bacteroides sp. 51]|uniref:DUF3276 family protein n=1 Tax=Bacteroides sp. 51 TaxID=2302938 RepID=UPI0013D2B0D5|nr:DUF3276 family protein [Bacteroides sp. 51]NDV83856.1 DUF3276 family protein [Bacteroides sp. 51]